MSQSRLEPLDPFIEGYLDYLMHVQRKAPGTVRDVRCTLRRLVKMLDRIAPGVALWQLDLEHYLRWIKEERREGRSENSIHKHISHLRGFLDYAWRGGRSTRNVMDGFQVRQQQRREVPLCITVEEAGRLVQACQQRTKHNRRDRMMVLLLYGCGLRTRELCDLNVADVDHEKHELLIRHGKGDKERLVPIPDAVYTELLAYLHDRKGKRGALFRTFTHKKRINSREVGRVVREKSMLAGLSPRLCPKQLRHSYATHLMDAGVDVVTIARLMGHRSPTETGVYLHAAEGKKQAAIYSFNKMQEEGS